MGMRIAARKPQSVLDYLLLVPVVLLGAFLMVVGLVFGLLLILTMPVIVWWKRRQLQRAGPDARDGQDTKVIDVEFTVRKDE